MKVDFSKQRNFCWFIEGAPEELVNMMPETSSFWVKGKKDEFYLLNISALAEIGLVLWAYDKYHYITIDSGLFAVMMIEVYGSKRAAFSLSQIWNWLLDEDMRRIVYLHHPPVKETTDKGEVLKFIGYDWENRTESA